MDLPENVLHLINDNLLRPRDKVRLSLVNKHYYNCLYNRYYSAFSRDIRLLSTIKYIVYIDDKHNIVASKREVDSFHTCMFWYATSNILNVYHKLQGRYLGELIREDFRQFQSCSYWEYDIINIMDTLIG
jgi:hypothetical protein